MFQVISQVISPKRIAVSVGAAALLLAGAPYASAVQPDAPPPVREEDRGSGDHLVVTVRQAGHAHDGTYEIRCHPGSGTHRDVDGACRAVERNTVWGKDPFARVPEGSVCTLQYGGPATARVTGRWAGRPVDAVFGRGNGCEIERWERFVPLLPDLGGPAAPVL